MQITKDTSREEALELGKECSRCGNCCSHDSGYMLDEDIKRIADHLGVPEKELKENHLKKIRLFNTIIHKPLTKKQPFGECVFYKEGACTIQDVKPLHCRIGSCSEHGENLTVWFKLNHLVNPNDPESIRQWKVYLESGGKNIPGGEMEELVPDKKTLKKVLEYKIIR